MNISNQDEVDLGEYVKYRRQEHRGGTPILSGKTWKTTHDPWRGIRATPFALDYLKSSAGPKAVERKREDTRDKIFELDYYDEDESLCNGW